MSSASNFEALLIVLAVIFLFAVIFGRARDQTPEAIGRQGELEVSLALLKFLDDTQYHLIDDVTLPFGKSTTQIDHLIVSRYGVFVIETKNMAGWIFGDAKQRHWTQVIYRAKHKFQNPLRQNFKHEKAVRRLCGLASNELYGVVAFVGDCTFKTTMPQEVVLGISGLISYVESKRTCVLAEEDVLRIIDHILSTRMPPDRKTERSHIQNVKSAINVSSEDENVACPRCGDQMVERTNKRTGAQFLGCVRFPTCRGIRRLTEN